MYDVKITTIRKSDYTDLQQQYENPLDEPCCVRVGDEWVSHNGERPNGFCPEAWKCIRDFVEVLAQGEGNFYDGWMKNPYSAMVSCNDGFRPVSFLIERYAYNQLTEPIKST